jgi:hypothetical protein
MRVLQGHGVGAVQDDTRNDPGAELMDARRAGGQDEVRRVRQATRAILSHDAERRAGVCQELLMLANSLVPRVPVNAAGAARRMRCVRSSVRWLREVRAEGCGPVCVVT